MKRKLKINWQSAIGEIIFIFLGITLAIWFQNWNDQRKEQALVLKLRNALIKENQANLKALPTTITQTESVLVSAQAMMGMMGKDYRSQEADQLDSLMSRFVLTPQFSGRYEAIREIIDSGRLEIIRNDSIRHYIIRWDLISADTKMMEDMNMNQSQNMVMPYLKDHFSMLAMDHKHGTLNEDLPPSAFDIDNRKILADFRFENILEMQFYSMSYQRQFYEDLLKTMKKLDHHLKANRP